MDRPPPIWIPIRGKKAFYSAVILRDSNAINALKNVDETIFANSNLKCDVFDLTLVTLMQGLFKKDGPDTDVGTLLENALIASNPHNIDHGRRPYANQILYPLLPLYRCIFTKDSEAEYRQVMREALESHKAYWKEDSYEQQGWISLPLMAAASIAYDYAGYQLDFETDYLPGWLVKKRFELKTGLKK